MRWNVYTCDDWLDWDEEIDDEEPGDGADPCPECPVEVDGVLVDKAAIDWLNLNF